MSINLRHEMPQTYAFIEACRAAFGKESINPQIKLGMEGAETFHASENGIEIGTVISEPKNYTTLDKIVIISPAERADNHDKRRK